MPWNGVIRYFDEEKNKTKKLRAKPSNKKEYGKIWSPFLRSFVKHLDSKGWFESTYMGFDERSNMDTAFDLLDSIKNKDGHNSFFAPGV